MSRLLRSVMLPQFRLSPQHCATSYTHIPRASILAGWIDGRVWEGPESRMVIMPKAGVDAKTDICRMRQWSGMEWTYEGQE